MNDLISRKALREEIESEIYWGMASHGAILQAIDEAPAVAYKLKATEPMTTCQQWIPVSERLPHHGGIVLCYLRCDDMRILQWDGVGQWWLGYGKGDDWQKKDVTHWMSLPEPPKEG